MGPFKKRHERLVAPGLELTILRRLPFVALLGSLMPAGLALLVRVLPPTQGVDAAKHIRTVDIFAIATEIAFLTGLFTVAVGAIVVHIMKGPAYVADPYPVSHADRPTRRPPSDQASSRTTDLH